MNHTTDNKLLTEADAYGQWQQDYAASIGMDKDVVNRSGIPIQPLYTSRD